ncbi:hypothetical protein U1Q18_051390 [Sarracenia purpurea var. burkii]
MHFCKLIHQGADTSGQNNAILTFMIPYHPERDRARVDDFRRNKRVNCQYNVRKLDGALVLVCADTFRSITLYSDITGKDNRGGSRQSDDQKERRESIAELLKDSK